MFISGEEDRFDTGDPLSVFFVVFPSGYLIPRGKDWKIKDAKAVASIPH
jgi:hypothetical protein